MYLAGHFRIALSKTILQMLGWRTKVRNGLLSFSRNGRKSYLSISKYERKTPIEHVQLRPGMYVGSVEWVTTDHWVTDGKSNQMTKRPVALSPALLKIFDEIIVNAADNNSRSGKLNEIRVNVGISNDCDLNISIQNDGSAIPIQKHPTENIYIPELIFGHLLTGSNFNDSDSRFTGGSHGYGAKLTNIFSKEFHIDIVDATSSSSYHQHWSKNMSVCETPKVTVLPKSKQLHNLVKISFTPDLSKFGFQQLSKNDRMQYLNDIVSLFQRRTIDVAGCLENVNVFFNDNMIPLKNFDEYAKLYLNSDASNKDGKVLYNSVKLTNEWQIGLAISPSDTFESVSFVNNVWTPRGGSHVQTVLSQITKYIEKELKTRGITKATVSNIKENLMLFLNSKVENPSFDGQTKDALLTKDSAFSQKATLSSQQLQELVVNSGIIDEITQRFRLLEDSRLQAITKKTSKRAFIDIPKLEDAHYAGTSRAMECTLILTEGDSAKALAVAGISAIGRELYGVMPLRGKLLNVRVANKAAVSKNEELINLCKALGLDFKKSYDGTNLLNEGLRYGKVMVMCDQDYDGSHIKGLIINFFDHFWPSLLKHEGFLQEFITPLVKVKSRMPLTALSSETKTKSSHAAPKIFQKSFYNLSDYQDWRESISTQDKDKYHVKYYKGLGTSTAIEGKEYFREIDLHRKNFIFSESINRKNSIIDKKDLSEDRDIIDLVFNKHRVEDRKNWLLNNYSKDLSLDLRQPIISYKDFVTKELIHFSFSDNLRSIPSVIDGLKPSQRKVLYGCFKKNLVRDELKVVQLAGYIAEQTAYHHGEVALQSTIINMAQDFVGANNIPLLEPIGQFGTRAKGGHDFASARYIFTKLSPLARMLFPPEDDAILQYQEEDGMQVEPKYYLPIIPLVLVNGAQGIGTGWSTNIPAHHPFHIISAVEAKLQLRQDPNRFHSSSQTSSLLPWFAGFRGDISNRFDVPFPTKTKSSKTAKNDLFVDQENILVAEEEAELASSIALGGPFVVSKGRIRRLNNTTVEITELPVMKWTEDYKKFLVDLVEKGKIKSFKEMHTTDHVRFEVSAPAAWLDNLCAGETSSHNSHQTETNHSIISKIVSSFRLTSKISLSNMHAFSAEGRMQRYLSAEEMLDDHFDQRWRGYELRKASMVEEQARQEALSRSKAKFVDDLIAGRLQLSRSETGGWQARALEDIERDLRNLGYDSMATIDQRQSHQNLHHARPYEYLLSMSLQSLTLERAQQLRQQALSAQQLLMQLQQQSEATMWQEDLQRLRDGYNLYLRHRYAQEEQDTENVSVIATKKRVSRSTSNKRRVSKTP